MLDTCGFAKDSFYLHKAWWTHLTQGGGDAFVHILPHWNWLGREGSPMRVMTYTNCETVELFLNDKWLGRVPVDPIEMW